MEVALSLAKSHATSSCRSNNIASSVTQRTLRFPFKWIWTLKCKYELVSLIPCELCYVNVNSISTCYQITYHLFLDDENTVIIECCGNRRHLSECGQEYLFSSHAIMVFWSLFFVVSTYRFSVTTISNPNFRTSQYLIGCQFSVENYDNSKYIFFLTTS